MSKPPTVHPIRKEQATPPVRDLLDDIQDTLGIPWPPANWRSYAMYPDAMRLFWERLKPSSETEQFLTAALEMSEHAYRDVEGWYEPGYEPAVPQASQQRIQWELDAFEYGNPQLLIQQAALSSALRGEGVGSRGGGVERRHPSAYRGPEIEMIPEQEATGEIRRVYGDIKQTLGLPIVNSDYQALAKWPTFFVPAWRDVKAWRGREEYRRLQQQLASMAGDAAQRLSEPVRIKQDELLNAVPDPSELQSLERTAGMFTNLLPGLIVNDALFRLAVAAGRRAATPQPEGVPAP